MRVANRRRDIVRKNWTQDVLTRRIDRCYLIAAWTRTLEKRRRYVELARHYRGLLLALQDGPRLQAA